MPRDLAQQVHKRLNQMSVNSHQRQFLTSGPMAALNQEMLRHTAEAVESNRLLQHLENYEKSGLPSDARLLARDCQFLSVGSARPSGSWASGWKCTIATPISGLPSAPSCSIA